MQTFAFRALCVALLAAGPAWAPHAHDLRHGTIHIGHVWTRPAAKGGVAEVYFALVNRGSRPDRLVGARSAAARAMLAETRADGAVVPQSAIELPPGRPVALRPGRLHIRLDDLAMPLEAGQAFNLGLLFAAAGPVEVIVMVEDAPGH